MKFIRTHREPFFRFDDPVTGREVVRITDPEHHCYHPYFYYPQFSSDGRWLAYLSHRTGGPQVYLLDLETGEAGQVTQSSNTGDEMLSPFSLMLDPQGEFLMYAEGQRLIRRTLSDGKETLLYLQESPWDGSRVYPGFSEDGRFSLLCQIHREDAIPATIIRDRNLRQFAVKPRCRLVLLDTDAGTETVVHEENAFLGHPQVRPGNPHVLSYCHEAPASMVDTRIWLIHADGTNQRQIGYVRSRAKDDPFALVTHEYFTPDGRHLAYIYFSEEYGRDGRFRMTDLETFEETDYGPVRNYAHPFHSPDGRLVVGDELSVAPANRRNDCLWLFDPKTRKESRLALHGSSSAPRGISTQDAHPHPVFTPDSKKVLFTSDRETGPEGNTSLYLVTV